MILSDMSIEEYSKYTISSSDSRRLASYCFPRENQQQNQERSKAMDSSKRNSTSSCLSVPTTPTIYECLEELESVSLTDELSEKSQLISLGTVLTSSSTNSTTKPTTVPFISHKYAFQNSPYQAPGNNAIPTKSHLLRSESQHSYSPPTNAHSYSSPHSLLVPTSSETSRSSQGSPMSPTRLSLSSSSTVTANSSPLPPHQKRFSTLSRSSSDGNKRHSRSKAISNVSAEHLDSDSDSDSEVVDASVLPESDIVNESGIASYMSHMKLKVRPRKKQFTTMPLREAEVSRMQRFNFEESVINKTCGDDLIHNKLEGHHIPRGMNYVRYTTSNNTTDGIIDLDVISKDGNDGSSI